MAEDSIIEFVIISFVVLLLIMLWMKTPVKDKTDPDNNKLDSITLAAFLSYDEAEEVRQFISANGFSAFTDTRSSFGRTANKYVVRILEKDRDAVAIIIKEYLDRAKEQDREQPPETDQNNNPA